MKTKLSMPVRLKLSELLMAEHGSFARMKMIHRMREDLSFSEEEQKLVGYQEHPTPQGTTMSLFAKPENDPKKEFDFGEIILELICEKLCKLDKTQNLDESQMDLYEAFASEIEKGKSENNH